MANLKDHCSPLEWEAGVLTAAGKRNDEIEAILKQKWPRLAPSSVRNALSRLYEKVEDYLGETVAVDDDTPEYRRRQRLARRARLVALFMKEMEKESFRPSRVSTNEDDCYARGIDIAQAAKSETIYSAAKSPIVLLSTELFTEARNRYYTSLFDGISAGRINSRYFFCLPTTIGSLRKAGKKMGSREMRSHLNAVEKLVKKDRIDLRCVKSADFQSWLLGEKEGMVLWKEPDNSTTLLVEFMTGPALEAKRRLHEQILQKAARVTPQAISEYVREVPA